MTTNNNNHTNPHSQEDALRRSDDDLLLESASTIDTTTGTTKEPATTTTTPASPSSSLFVPLTMGGSSGRTHIPSAASKALLDDIPLSRLEQMTNCFYETAFQDTTLDTFIRDHNDPHGERFAKWIHQKLTGSNVWDQERHTRSKQPVTLAHDYQHVVHDRSSAHAAAWYSPKRPQSDVGRKFQLDECRVWMRLHFWALRRVLGTGAFADYYVRFIGHFVRVYEVEARKFARESWRWSEDPTNIETYLRTHTMSDVLGLSVDEALAQLPTHEANDPLWPYNQTPQ